MRSTGKNRDTGEGENHAGIAPCSCKIGSTGRKCLFIIISYAIA